MRYIGRMGFSLRSEVSEVREKTLFGDQGRLKLKMPNSLIKLGTGDR